MSLPTTLQYSIVLVIYLAHDEQHSTQCTTYVSMSMKLENIQASQLC